jgi:hypothetical protein
MRIAVIRNPTSNRNARAGIRPTGLPTAEPRSPAELRAALAEFRTGRIVILVIDGGDGTIREVLSALVEMDWRPRLAVLPRGKVNLVARDVGLADHCPDLLARLAGGAGRIERRALLRLDHRDGTSHGLFLGAGAFTKGWQLANAQLHPRGLRAAGAVAVALALTLGRATADASLNAGIPVGLRCDGQSMLDGPCFVLLATTLERLMLGLWPFWGNGDGAIKSLAVAAPPRRLAAALPALARGRPKEWMEPAGYVSRRSGRLDIVGEAPVILDGEPFTPAAGRLILSSGPEMEFVRP